MIGWKRRGTGLGTAGNSGTGTAQKRNDDRRFFADYRAWKYRGNPGDAARQSGHFLFLPGNADRPRDAAGADWTQRLFAGTRSNVYFPEKQQLPGRLWRDLCISDKPGKFPKLIGRKAVIDQFAWVCSWRCLARTSSRFRKMRGSDENTTIAVLSYRMMYLGKVPWDRISFQNVCFLGGRIVSCCTFCNPAKSFWPWYLNIVI